MTDLSVRTRRGLLAAVATLVGGGAAAQARTFDCPAGGDCTGTRRGDRITALGSNVIRGARGNDRIEAQNGTSDIIDCGRGTDVAAIDVGLDSTTRCERLETSI